MKICGDTVVTIACGLALLAAMAVARAQALADPTRPPAALGNPATGVGENPAATGLHTIIRSNCGKPAAIINGEYVMLGGHVGDARVVKIDEDSVTLKSATGRETLKLMPGVEITPVAGGAGAAEKQGACIKTSDAEMKK